MDESSGDLKISQRNQHKVVPIDGIQILYTDERHKTEAHQSVETKQKELVEWRIVERMKTGSVALVICLNIGVDPPDIVRPNPCARLECWIDPFCLAPPKALEAIGKRLQDQYERWQPKAKYKQSLDPTVDDLKKLCSSIRKNAKGERVLLHFNGHGVPRPTPNGELWVFNKNFTQYIPLSIHDIHSWLGSPAIYVFDYSGSGQLVNSYSVFQQQRKRNDDCIMLAACGPSESLPQNPEFPADIFTACLTTPIMVALRWFCSRSTLTKLSPDIVDKIPGRLNDRKTMLGELNWIFTAITDTIAWTVLPHDLFQKLFRQDLLVASIFRNYLLAERILKSVNCTPMSLPRLPAAYQHPLWQTWDLAADSCLSQVKNLLDTPDADYNHSTFFTEQLTAFEVWLDFGSQSKKPPQQLPIVLQVLLSQVHRLRALQLLGRFLDLGPWAVHLALTVGIFPYVLKLLQSPAAELKQILVFIWAKILCLDTSCQSDLVKDNGHAYLISFLSSPGLSSEMYTLALHSLCIVVFKYRDGQSACLQKGLLSALIAHLESPYEDCRRWACLCYSQCWDGYEDARHKAIEERIPEKLIVCLSDNYPEVRAAALNALSTFYGDNPPMPSDVDGLVVKTEMCNTNAVLEHVGDASILVRKEILVVISRFIHRFLPNVLKHGHNLLVHHMCNAAAAAAAAASNNNGNGSSSSNAGTNNNNSNNNNSNSNNSSNNGSSSSNNGNGNNASSSSTTSSTLGINVSGEHIHAFRAGRISPSVAEEPHDISDWGTIKSHADSNLLHLPSMCLRVINTLFHLSNDPMASLSQPCRQLISWLAETSGINNRPELKPMYAGALHGVPSSSSTTTSTTATVGMRRPASAPSLRHLDMSAIGLGGGGADGGTPPVRVGTPKEAKATPKKTGVLRSFLSGGPSSPRAMSPVATFDAHALVQDNTQAANNADGSSNRAMFTGPHCIKSSLFEWSASYLSKPILMENQEDDTQALPSWRITDMSRAIKNAESMSLLPGRRVEDQVAILDNENRMAMCVEFHRYETVLVAADAGNFLSVWDYEKGVRVNLFPNGNPAHTRCTSISLQNNCDSRSLGVLFVGSDDGMVRVWGFGSRQDLVPTLVAAWCVIDDMNPVSSSPGLILKMTNNSKLVATGGTSVVKVWDLGSELCSAEIATGSQCSISCLETGLGDAEDNSNLMVAGDANGVIRLFDTRTPTGAIASLSEHQGYVVDVHLDHPGSLSSRLVSGSIHGDIKIWDLRMRSSVLTIEAHKEPMTALGVHRYAPVMATGSQNQFVKVLSSKGEHLNTIRYHDGFLGQRIGPISCLAFHPLKLLLAAGATDSIISIYAAEGELV